MVINRPRLFQAIRTGVFHGHFVQGQVDGINFILDTWEKSSFTDKRWLAYMLGTAYHETAGTMKPIHEFGSDAYFTRMYGIEGRRPDVARIMGNTQPGDGIKYAGRGYVQLTWKNNYQRAGHLLGIDLVANPDRAMDPTIAARIMFEGMTDEKIIFEDTTSDDAAFSFTGRVLENYFNPTTEDWINARRIINGTQAAALIATTARDFNAAIFELGA